MKNIDDLFKAYGGTLYFAALLNVHQTTVFSWKKSGIPVKYWGELIRNCNITADTLLKISQRAKNGK